MTKYIYALNCYNQVFSLNLHIRSLNKPILSSNCPEKVRFQLLKTYHIILARVSMQSNRLFFIVFT